MVEVAATVLADDIDRAVGAHRHAFMLLIGGRKRVAGVRQDGQRAEHGAGTIDLDDLPGFLAQQQDVAGCGQAVQRVDIRQGVKVGEIRQTRRPDIEERRGVGRGRRSVRSGAGGEIHVRQEHVLRVDFLRDDEAAGRGIEGQPLEPVVADRGAQLHGQRIRAGQRGVGGVGELDKLAVALLGHDELAAADIGQAFGVVEFRALRAGTGGQGHRVDQLTGRGDLHD